MNQETQLQDVNYALATSPGFTRDGICFAARASGLYCSADGGQTWQFAYATLDPASPLTTMAVAVSPNFASDQAVFAGVAGGVLHSADGGRHWRVLDLPSPPPVVTSLIISPAYAHDRVVFAGTVEDGVLRSADGGEHWATWNFGLLDLNVLCMAASSRFAEDETLWIGGETGVFRSSNGGRSWREVNFPAERAPVLSLALSPNEAGDGTLFAGTESHGLYRSADRGRTWIRLGKKVIRETVNQIILSTQFPTQPDVLALTHEALLISRDGGQSWAAWKADLDLSPGAACVAAPQGLGASAPLLLGQVDGAMLRL